MLQNFKYIKKKKVCLNFLLLRSFKTNVGINFLLLSIAVSKCDYLFI